MLANKFEVLTFPYLFPMGNGGFDVKYHMDTNLDLWKYIYQQFLNVHG